MFVRPVLILGAGVAGLGAADALKRSGIPYVLIEREDGPGGLIRTDEIGDYRLDRAGHFIHSRTEQFQQVLSDCGVEMLSVARRSAILLERSIVPYPVQYNLWAAPSHLARAVAAELPQLPVVVNLDGTFDQVLSQLWGHSLAEAFFKPFHRKMWRVELSKLPADWAASFVPHRDLALIEKGLSAPLLDHGYNATFLYPASGRVGELAEALARPHLAQMRLQTEVVAINAAARRVRLGDGGELEYSALINTAPLSRLVSMLGRPTSPTFRASNLLNLRVGFRGTLKRSEHWYYVPDQEIDFYRVGFPCNVAPNVARVGSQILSLEYGLDSALVQPTGFESQAVAALEYLAERDVLEWSALELVDAYVIQPAYVACRLSSTPELQQLECSLKEDCIYLAGRYGRWDYLSIEQSYLSGWEAGGQVLGRPAAF